MALVDDAAPEPWEPEDRFGSRLALVRNHLGWNVKEAADLCGINDQTWRNWEAGKMPRDLIATATQISTVTGCSMKWLVAGSQNWKKLTASDLPVIDGEGRSDSATRKGQRRLRFLSVVPP